MPTSLVPAVVARSAGDDRNGRNCSRWGALRCTWREQHRLRPRARARAGLRPFGRMAAVAAYAVRTVSIWLAASIPRGGAISSTVNLGRQNTSWILLARDIGLEPQSTVFVDLYNEIPARNTYVLLITYSQLLKYDEEEPDTLEGSGDSNGGTNSYLISAWRTVLYDHVQATFQIRAAAKERYYMGILNVHGQELKITGKIGLVNPGGRELPLQDRGLPAVLLASSFVFTSSCLLLLAVLKMAPRRGRTAIHGVIGSVFLLKGLSSFLQWNDRMQVELHGTTNVFAQVGWQLIDKVQTIAELMMFLLIALGWKLLRSTLPITEVRLVVGISVISFFLGVFEVACTSESACNGYQLSRYILHSLCYLAVIIAMNLNLQMIHQQLLDAPASLETGKTYGKLRAYKAFRWVFLAFVVAPTAELFLKVSIMPWDIWWIFVLVQHSRTWVIYAVIASYFRPDPMPLRVFELTRDAISDDDDEAAE